MVNWVKRIRKNENVTNEGFKKSHDRAPYLEYCSAGPQLFSVDSSMTVTVGCGIALVVACVQVVPLNVSGDGHE